MGLFDGRIEPETASGPARGSTAHVAGLLGAPVVLVVDARGQSHSIAALLHGFVDLRHGSIRIAGVILNRVGLAAPRAGAAAGVRTRRRAGARRHPAHRRIEPSRQGISAWSPPSSMAARPRAAVDAMTELVARHVDLAGGACAVAASRRRPPSRGTPRAAEPASPATSPSRWPRAGRSASATPSTPSCCAPPGARRRRVRPADRTAARRTPPRWCCPADSLKQFTAELSANDRCAPADPRAGRDAERRCTPNAPA